ncbi:unnamed protein product [Miscanthus lutarioriparius]|uniref:Retrovirus-related Pol polyprotein from transposon TNT 1-94-like beta-barrel domain-containing protein n=1 Tax=Miscanthus lutarioriparius TaxID=422564 RepID=A0A811PHD5_9POAL|nr:unnamed protein product [Miscanthus lutarioriparius]
MASMKFDLPLLDYKTRFALWQVKMRAILAQSSDLDEALDGFGGKGQKSWTAEEKRKDYWFSSYKSVQSGDVVRMGDNNPREIMGIGSVQIKMHDGMMHTLKDVRHIPGMAKNLISLSTLDAEGLSTDVSSVGSDEEQEHVSVKVEHVDDQEVKIVNNNIHDIVQHSPPVLQPQNQSIANHRTKRSCGSHPHLIEECDIIHYAFSCAEQVENIHDPAMYTEVVVSSDREKWISAMQEEMQSLEKNGTWDVVRLPKQKNVVRCKWIFKIKEGLSSNEPPIFKTSCKA